MLVSIMMPAHNASCYISDAIRSCIEQTYQNWELIIVDDGSTDNTYRIARSFKDPRIKVFQIKKSGCPTARNECLDHCTGEVIARLDADDLHHPERLEAQLPLLRVYDIVSCGYKWLKGNLLIERKSQGMNPRAYMEGRGGSPVCASIICSRRIYDRVRFDPKLLAGSDGEWNFRAILEGYTWGYLDKPYYVQRRHGQQLSQAQRALQRKVHEDSRRKYSGKWRQDSKNQRTRR